MRRLSGRELQVELMPGGYRKLEAGPDGQIVVYELSRDWKNPPRYDWEAELAAHKLAGTVPDALLELCEVMQEWIWAHPEQEPWDDLHEQFRRLLQGDLNQHASRMEDVWEVAKGITHPAVLTVAAHCGQKQSSGWWWAACAAKHKLTPAHVVDRLAGQGEVLALAAATNVALPVATMRRLAGQGTDRVRERLARHRKLPPDVVMEMARDRWVPVRGAVARHPELPAAAAIQLARDASPHVRMELGRRDDLPEEAIRVLARDHDMQVRVRMLHQKLLPDDVLAELARDPQAEVRREASAHPRISAEQAEELLKDSDRLVRAHMQYWLDGRKAGQAMTL